MKKRNFDILAVKKEPAKLSESVVGLHKGYIDLGLHIRDVGLIVC